MKKIICLSGLAGSGKSAIGRELASKLKMPFLSIGNFTRDYAAGLRLDIHQFQDLAAMTPGLDEEIDKAFIAKINTYDSCVLDYRLGFHLFKSAFNVLLTVDPTEAVNRVIRRQDQTDGLNEHYSTHELISDLNKRNNDMRSRFLLHYNVDFTEQSNYQFVLETTSLSIDQCVHLIIEDFQSKI